jgi:hypothetical protein
MMEFDLPKFDLDLDGVHFDGVDLLRNVIVLSDYILVLNVVWRDGFT